MSAQSNVSVESWPQCILDNTHIGKCDVRHGAYRQGRRY